MVLAAVGGALVLALSGCGGAATGPTPASQAPDQGPDTLPIKLNALSADECFLSPDMQAPKGCEKYVTELGNTARSVRQRAGSQDQRLASLADEVDKAVGAYRSHACNTVSSPGNGPCTQALTDIASTLSSIRTAVAQQATTR
jgi:hypothetical protein